jgi:uncharacterized SAM-binding protein YcdF (DUF218 family)
LVLSFEPADLGADPGLLMDRELPGPIAASDNIWTDAGMNDSPTESSSKPVPTDVWFAVRVLAFCFGVCVVVNVVAALRTGFDANLWWIDLRFLPAAVRSILTASLGTLLIGAALRPEMRRPRRIVTLAVILPFAAAAVIDAIRFWTLWADDSIRATSPVPVSLVVVLVLGVVAWGLRRSRPEPRSSRLALAGAVALAFVVGVPLLQIVAFGTTDYRRPADAIVVFGAKVRDDGTASTVLRERVIRASELYRAGLAGTVVMTGGIEPTGFDETVVMRDLAVTQGVPAEAIVLDRQGVTTDASVERTAQILRERGLSTVLAVSQPYHLPRIKLAYARAGLGVWTVPADVTLVPGTARLVAREIPAFWLYYLRAVAG